MGRFIKSIQKHFTKYIREVFLSKCDVPDKILQQLSSSVAHYLSFMSVAVGMRKWGTKAWDALPYPVEVVEGQSD